MNFFDVQMTGGQIDTGSLVVDVPEEVSGSVSTLGVRPEDLTTNPIDSEEAVTAQVNVFEQLGAHNIVYLNVDNQDEEVLVQVDPARHVSPGDTIELGIVQDRFHLFDENGEAVYNPPLPRERPPKATSTDEKRHAD